MISEENYCVQGLNGLKLWLRVSQHSRVVQGKKATRVKPNIPEKWLQQDNNNKKYSKCIHKNRRQWLVMLKAHDYCVTTNNVTALSSSGGWIFLPNVADEDWSQTSDSQTDWWFLMERTIFLLPQQQQQQQQSSSPSTSRVSKDSAFIWSKLLISI